MKKLVMPMGALLLAGACAAQTGADRPASPSPSRAASASPAPSPTFDVMEFVVQGNTVLPPLHVERAVQPYLGPGKTFKDIEAARAALEQAFQDAGFLSVVVSLPNQRVDQGEVLLDVTEASVEKLRVTGARYHLPSKVREGLPSVAEGEVPYFPQMQDELDRAQTSHLQLTPLISAGSSPDKLQVEIKVEDQRPLSGSVELNSGQSLNTERGRLLAVASYGNLFQRGHRVGVSWQYAPTQPSDANTLSLTYGVPITPRDDVTLAITDSKSDTPTTTAVGGATLTRGQTYGLSWRHELPVYHWPVDHDLTVSLDFKDNKDRTRTGSGLVTAKPPLRYATVTLGYNLSWFSGSNESTSLWTSLGGSSRALAGREVDCEGFRLDQFECKRSGSTPDFLVWKLGVEHTRALGAGWQLNAGGEAQIASGPLATGEQYSLGGVDTVRGYYDFEQSGDQGWRARLEVVSPPWLSLGDWRASSLAFVDRGFVMTKRALAGQIARVHLGSYGLGLRIDNGEGLQAALDVAMPVFETSRADDDGRYEPATRKRSRWELSVRQSF